MSKMPNSCNYGWIPYKADILGVCVFRHVTPRQTMGVNRFVGFKAQCAAITTGTYVPVSTGKHRKKLRKPTLNDQATTDSTSYSPTLCIVAQTVLFNSEH